MNEPKKTCTLCFEKYYARVPEQKRCFDCIQRLPVKKVCVYGPEHNLYWHPHYATGEMTWATCSCGEMQLHPKPVDDYLPVAIEYAKVN